MTPAKRSAYQILSAFFLLVVTVIKVQFVGLTPISNNGPSTYQLQKSTTERSSTCKSHCHKLQQAEYLPVTEERYRALFCM
jgi:hypothetical protein